MSLALQEVPGPQHLVGRVAESNEFSLRARLGVEALGFALRVYRSLSQGDNATCVTFLIGMYTI